MKSEHTEATLPSFSKLIPVNGMDKAKRQMADGMEVMQARSQELIALWGRARTADVENAVKALTALVACRDPKVLMDIQKRWATGAAERLKTEMKSYSEQAAAMGKAGMAKLKAAN